MNDKQRLYLGLAQRRLEKGHTVTITGSGTKLVADALKDLGFEILAQTNGFTIYPDKEKS